MFKEVENLKMSLKWLIKIMFVVLTGIILTTNIISQTENDLPEELGTALGIYKINSSGEKAKKVADFLHFNLKKFPGQDTDNPEIDNAGKVFVDGEVKTTNGTIFKFKKAFLKRRASGEYENIEFETVESNGLSYTFKGKFLEKEVQEEEGGNYTKIRGILTKYKNGKKLDSYELPFFEYAIL